MGVAHHLVWVARVARRISGNVTRGRADWAGA